MIRFITLICLMFTCTLQAYTPTMIDGDGGNCAGKPVVDVLIIQRRQEGRYFDQETGLHYFRARYFDSKLNTFISRDSLGYVDGFSLTVAYFSNGMGLDPSGLIEASPSADAERAAEAEAENAKVPGGGTISVDTDAIYPGKIPDRHNMAITVSGRNECEKCCWVQFMWIEMNPPPKRPVIGLSGGVTWWTTNPRKPKWHMDGGPCYSDDGGTVARTATSLTLYDKPGNIIDALVSEGQLPVPTKKNPVKYTLHFDTYLICDKKSVYKISWNTSYTNTKSSNYSPPTHTLDATEPNGSPSPDQVEVLNNRFPNQTVY